MGFTLEVLLWFDVGELAIKKRIIPTPPVELHTMQVNDGKLCFPHVGGRTSPPELETHQVTTSNHATGWRKCTRKEILHHFERNLKGVIFKLLYEVQ